MIVPLSGAGPSCGAKAAALGELLRSGPAVPPGFVEDGADVAAATTKITARPTLTVDGRAGAITPQESA